MHSEQLSVSGRIPTLVHYEEKDVAPIIVEGFYDEETQLWVSPHYNFPAQATFNETQGRPTTKATHVTHDTTKADTDRDPD